MKSRIHHTRALPALMLSLLGGIGLMAVPAQEANAQTAVLCFGATGPCASSVDVAATTTAVTAMGTTVGYTHTYLTTGVGGSPSGMIALLGGINERLGMVTNANDESVENDDLAARQRIYDERMMDIRGSRLPKPSAVRRACVQATAAAGRAGAASGGGAAGRAAAKEVLNRYNDGRPEIQGIADSGMNRRDLGTCTREDIDQKRPGCQAAGVGDRPGADLRLSSLFDGGKPDAPNVSLDERGFKIAKQVLSNVLPTPADSLRTEAERKSQGGIVYQLRANLYTTRAATAAEAMGQIAGFSTGLDVPEASRAAGQAKPFLDKWASYKSEYEEIFGAGTFPEAPSEREIVRFAAIKHYASVQNEQKLASMTPEEVALAQLEVAATNGYLNYLMLERLERQNAVLSALLSHNMDPITSDGLRSMRSGLGGQTSTGTGQ